MPATGPWQPGATRKTLSGYEAFSPNPLPTTLEYPEPTVNTLAAATAAVHRLAGASRLLPSPEILMGPYVRLEAVLSSKIEGTQTTVDDLLVFEAQEDTEAAGDVREVLNYMRALDHVVTRLNDLPLSNRLLREAHAILLDGVRGEHGTPGEFRTTQNWIGSPGSTIATAAFVPPPPDAVGDAMADLERFLHNRDLPNLIAVALAHYQFETIHPFVDGNGRIGRLLIPLMLIERGILDHPVLYLSAYFERHRSRYYELLNQTRHTGDLFPWVDFFLDGVITNARDAEDRTVRLVDLQHGIRHQLLEARATATALRLAERLLDRPYVTAPLVARLLDVTFPTAQKAIDDLQERGVLEEITGQRRNRVYAAPTVIEIAYGAPGPDQS
jgi:Fic family protein